MNLAVGALYAYAGIYHGGTLPSDVFRAVWTEPGGGGAQPDFPSTWRPVPSCWGRAPAGYGKTTLVSSWLQESQISSAWLSLDEGDNDLIRFLQNFLTALQKIVPTIQPEWLSLLQRTQPAPYDMLLSILINEIAAHGAPFVLVLDDFHVIHTQPILEMLTFLIDHAPPQLHLLLITRIDPPLPLFRLRARDQMLEIRAEQLRFTRQETTGFLNEVMGLKLPADDIVAMLTRTEGWIAGLQLAALSMKACDDTHSFVSAFMGSHHHIVDYLTEEVLKLQPERVRMFLLRDLHTFQHVWLVV